MKEIKNIIIQNLDTFQQDLINQAMQLTGQKTASKAIFQLISEHLAIKKQLFDLKSKETAPTSRSTTKPIVSSRPSSTELAVTKKDIRQNISKKALITLGHIKGSNGILSTELAKKALKNGRTIRDRLKILKDAGLIKAEKIGNDFYYYAL
jgi:hypothetical protein